MSEKFSISKLFKGFNIFNGASLGKLLFYGSLVAIGIGIYHATFVKRTSVTYDNTKISGVQQLHIHKGNTDKSKMDMFIAGGTMYDDKIKPFVLGGVKWKIGK